MGNILLRFEEIARREGISIGALERKIGASKGVISRAITNGTDIQSKWLVNIVENYPSYSADWLLTGDGPMLKQECAAPSAPSINYDRTGAPYYNVDFIGGFDAVLNDQTVTPAYFIDFAPFNKPGVVWCNITGHSMEPELNNGDIIAMREVTSPIEYLPAGEIYGIVTDDYRTVKRLRMSQQQQGFVRLIPTNKSPQYAEQEIPVAMIRKVFAVLGSVHRLF